MRQVLIYRGEDGFWFAECPSLPGWVTHGETEDAALANMKEAVQAYVGALEVDNLPVPQEHFDANSSFWGLGPACGMIILGV